MKQLTSIDSRKQLITDHSQRVYRIAYQLKNVLPSSMEIADLVQVGLIGLLEASNSYEPRAEVPFTAFAAIRIRGAMLDEIRRQTRAPRWLRRFQRTANNSQREIENELGRPARQSEIATRAGISPAALADVALRVQSIFRQELDDYEVESEDIACDPFSNLADERFKLALATAFMKLPQRERLIMRQYYQNDWTLDQIARHHEISESRVCQLKQQSILTLRHLLAEWCGVNHSSTEDQHKSLDLADIA